MRSPKQILEEIMRGVWQKIREGERLSEEDRIYLFMEKIIGGWLLSKEMGLNYRPQPIKDEIKKILIVYPAPIGDVVIATPVIVGLREEFPEASISFLGREDSIDVVKENPLLDEVILFPKFYFAEKMTNSMEPFNRIYREVKGFVEGLQRERFDLVINLEIVNPQSATLVPLIDGKYTRGMIFNEFGRLEIAGSLWALYALYIRHNRVMRDLHLLIHEELNLKLAGLNPSSRRTDLFIDNKTRERCKKMLQERGLEDRDFVIGIVPGAYLSARRWPKGYFVDLSNRLIREYSAKIIIFGGKNEIGLAREIEDSIKGESINLCGKTSLKELAAFLSICDHVITNDTGPMHIAGAVGARCIVMCGPRRRGPYAKGHILIEADLPCVDCGPTTECKRGECMNVVSPEDVYLTLKFQRGESEEIMNNTRINLYSVRDKEIGRLFSYHPSRRKDWQEKEVADEIFKLIHLNLWIRESNRVDHPQNHYEEDLSIKEVERFFYGIEKVELVKGIDRCIDSLKDYEVLLKEAITKINTLLVTPQPYHDLLTELNELYEEMDEDIIGRILSFLNIIYPKRDGSEWE